MKRTPTTTRSIAKLLVIAVLASLALLPAEVAAQPVADPLPMARPVDLKNVRLLDGPFREAMLRNRSYLLSLDPDRFLHMFRVTAGLPTSAEPYGGWEAPRVELRGHSLGHYLSALSLLYASTGEPQLKERADYIVSELAKCQQALPDRGYNPGYLSAFAETFFDRVESGEPVWAPYYTLHKIMAGLLDAHLQCDNPQALEVVTRMADWVQGRMDPLTQEQQQRTLRMEFGGMNEVLANLSGVTGQVAHLDLARMFDHRAVFDPLARGQDQLDGLHANTQIPKFIGAARIYELSREPRYRDIATFAWQRVAQHRSYVIGGHSDHEVFFPVSDFAQHLSAATAESCNTYNMLKLTRHLFGWAPSAETMDFYERGLYNHILASQDPQEGMFAYFLSLKPAHFKTYSLPHDSFWCCVGTGMENHCKYGDTIYFQDDDSLYVNLFIASELSWPERGLRVRMETRFPEDEIVQLQLRCDEPVEGRLKLRWPAWARTGFSVKVNGTRQSVDGEPGCYVTLSREWIDGDRVEVRVPMSLHAEPLPGTTGIVALLYGPIVLAGELGCTGLERISPYAKNQLDLVHVPTPPAPTLVADAQDLLNRIEAVPDRPLTFRTQGLGRPDDVTLIPLYQMHHQRYSVYWDLLSEGGWEAYQAELARADDEARARARRYLDFVKIGNRDSERRHNLQGQRTQAGSHAGRGWRHATNGGWFSYDVAVQPEGDNRLQAVFWGDDTGARTFDIMVEGETIATQQLERNVPGEFFEVQWRLAPELTAGKKRVTVRFQAHPGHFAGGLFGLATLK